MGIPLRPPMMRRLHSRTHEICHCDDPKFQQAKKKIIITSDKKFITTSKLSKDATHSININFIIQNFNFDTQRTLTSNPPINHQQ